YLPAPQTEDEESWMPVRRVRVTQDSAVIPGLRIGDLVEDGCGFVAGGRQEIHLPDGRVFVATVDVTHCGNGSLQVVHDGVTSLALQIYDCNIEDDVYAVFRGELLQYDFIYLRPALYLHIFGERLWKADGSYTLYPDDEPSDGETASIRREAIDHLYLYDETARGWLAIQQTGSLWTLLASPPHDPVAPGSCPAQLTVGWSAP
ncbi:MAG: hypothetical protein ACREJ2_17340, partial [Planctomycetota bacterium]